ncbi:MAG: hypothetical protein PVG71_05150 [Anaerolineae bacterium]|jgi:hypothetical protein
MIITLQLLMSVILFALGLSSCVAGLWTILSKQYQQALKRISAHSAKVSSQAVTEAGLASLIQAMSSLVEAINQLIRTSVGVGVFLCLAGVVLCSLAFWMLSALGAVGP